MIRQEKIEEIYNIKENNQISYLGIIIDNKRNLFHEYKLNILEKAKKTRKSNRWNNRTIMQQITHR